MLHFVASVKSSKFWSLMLLWTSIIEIIATSCYIYAIKLHSVRIVSLALHPDPPCCDVAQPVLGIVFIQASQYFPKQFLGTVQDLAQARDRSW